MKLINPIEIRNLYANQLDWLTLSEISKGTQVAIGSVSAALNGDAVRPSTVKKLAAALGKKPTEIAEFVN